MSDVLSTARPVCSAGVCHLCPHEHPRETRGASLVLQGPGCRRGPSQPLRETVLRLSQNLLLGKKYSALPAVLKTVPQSLGLRYTKPRDKQSG